MQENEAILKRQVSNIRFKNADMDFMLNWAIGIGQIIGMSPSQAFYAVHGIKDGDPAGWRKGFQAQGDYQLERAGEFIRTGQKLAAGQLSLGAAYAYRAAIQYTDPTTPDFDQRVQAMQKSFRQGIDLIGVPMRPVEVPFEQTTLPGYYLQHDDQLRPLLMMVGGGDTFCEDLFYFAGYPGWKRGYNVIMVDLPGQGITPNRNQHFRADMDKPFSTVLDWVEANALKKPEKIAVYGVSGGGYFSAQGVAADRRVNAWIASTPLFNIAETFQREMGNALKTPGWLLNLLVGLAGSVNESAEINLKKYAWQFGTTDFKTAIDAVMVQTKPVDCSGITCPSLFLVSEGEGPELKRQTHILFDDFTRRGVNVTLREFTAAEGADGHCELNNLRLVHLVIFDWLDKLFGHEPGDVRLYC